MTHFFFSMPGFNWYHAQDIANSAFICGYCSTSVSSVKGYNIAYKNNRVGSIFICPNCNGPVLRDKDGTFQYPSPAFGNDVQHVPQDLTSLYEEARRCTSNNCYTAAVLLCRKMLMNIAVQEGAAEGMKFIEYVDFLSSKGYVPPNGKHWVDHIRKRGNEATHEIALMNDTDAKDLIGFLEMLLRFIYEFPNLVPKAP